MNFEHILLNGIISNNSFAKKALSIIRDDSFQNIGSSEIFKIIKSYFIEYNKSPNIPEIVASARNISSSDIKKLIVEQIREITSVAQSEFNESFMLQEVVKFVKNGLITQAAIKAADGLSKNSEELKLQAYSIFEEAQKVRIDTDLGLEFNDIDSRIEYYQSKLEGLLTGHEEFDKRLGPGFLKKTLSIFAAPPGVGKSLLLTHLASNVIKRGKNVLLVSLEMSDFETVKRIDANVLDLPINDLKSLDPIVIKNKFNALSNVGQLFVKEYAPGSFSALDLSTLIDAYKVEKNIEFDLVLVDYLGLMKSNRISPNAGPYAYFKSISEELRSIAVKKELRIISPAQLNRSAINNIDADNTSMAESAGILQTADFILLLLQTPEMKEKNEYIFKISKNRFSGNTSYFSIYIDYTKMRFVDNIFNSTMTEHTPTILPSNVDSALTISDDFSDISNELKSDKEISELLKNLI